MEMKKFRTVVTLFFLLFFAGIYGCVSTSQGNGNDEPSGLCGNGVVDPGEQCDDGNLMDHDGCSSSCQLESFCGNGRVEPNEECDDGNYEAGDGCSPECTLETGCGNGKLELGEECDDDNLFSGDGCSADCIDEEPGAVCGNGIVEIGEGCDDGNTQSGDGCSADCHREDGCGNGTHDAGEQCDDGNNISGDGCSADCKIEFLCGDGKCDTDSHESCELCPQDCCPNCGNGLLDEGEGCDDGNNVPGDGCSAGCTDEDGTSTCGNGIIEPGEVCEPNTEYADGKCGDDCTWAWQCGDGVCSHDTGETCELCPGDCCPDCGNYVVDTENEQCDTDDFQGLTCEDLGYEGGTLGCTDHCQFDTSQCTGQGPVCGNGVVEAGEECDGGNLNGNNCYTLGFTDGTLFCNPDCTFNTSGCSGQFIYLEEHFDDPYSIHGWRMEGTWERGKPANVGPQTAFDGPMCAGTNIDGNAPKSSEYDSPAGLYSPVFHVPEDATPAVTVWAWCDLYDSSSADEGWTIEYSIDGGQTWLAGSEPNPPFDRTIGGRNYWNESCGADWHVFTVMLPQAAGHDVQIRIKAIFDHYSDKAGVYVDAVQAVDRTRIPLAFSTPTQLGMAVVGQQWTRTITVWGGSGNYSLTRVSGTNDTWLTLDPDTGVLSGTPSESDVGSGSITIKAMDTSNPQNSTTATFTFSVLNAVFYDDFEGDTSSWNVTSPWEIGTPTPAGGPSSCTSGTHCVGTVMNAHYPNNTDWECVESPEINLPSGAAQVIFQGWNDTESSFDGVKFEVQSGGQWHYVQDVTPAYQQSIDTNTVDAWSGHDATWHEYSADISQYSGGTVRIRWCFYSDSSVTYPGFFLDDVMILAN